MKNKVLLYLIPFAVVLFAAVMFLEKNEDTEIEAVKEASVFVEYDEQNQKNTDKLSNRRERMSKEYDEKARERRHTKPDDFFSSAKESRETIVTEEVAIEEPVAQEPVKEKKTYESYTQTRPKTSTTTAKAVVKEEAYQPAQQTPQQQTRRRVGFSSNSTGASTGVAKSAGNVDSKILVVVHRAVTVKNGQVVKLRVVQDVTIGSLKLAAGTFIDGLARFGNNRLYIDVEGLNVNGNIVKQDFSAYSMSGLEGLEVNGSISSEANQDVAAGSVDYVERRINLPVVGGVVSRRSNEALKEQSVPIDAGTKFYLM